MASPLDPEASGVIGWALSGIGTTVTGFVFWIYRRLRRLTKIEADQLISREISQFEATKIMPELKKLEHRIANVEKLEARLGSIQTHIEHVNSKVSDLHEKVAQNAADASTQLTGVMKRISDQRQEDKEIQLERLDSLKELIEAKIK